MALDFLVAALKNHPSSTAVQERGASALRSVATGAGAEPTRAKAVRLGAVPLLVAALHGHVDTATVLTTSLAALLCLATKVPNAEKSDEDTDSMMEPPLTPAECDSAILLRLLETHADHSNIQELALSLLWGHLAGGSEPSDGFARPVALASKALRGHKTVPAVLSLASQVIHCCLPRYWADGYKGSTGSPAKLLLSAVGAHASHRALQESAWQAMLTLMQAGHSEALTDVDMQKLQWRLVSAMEKFPGAQQLQRVGLDVVTLCCLPETHVSSTPEVSQQKFIDLGAPDLALAALKRHWQNSTLQESGCAALQALAGSDAGALVDCDVEEAVLASLASQPRSLVVQIRGLDLIAALVAARQRSPPVAVDLAIAALNRFPEVPELVEVAIMALARLLTFDEEKVEEPMDRIAEQVVGFLGEPPSDATRTVLRVIAQGSTDIATRLTALRGVPALLQALDAVQSSSVAALAISLLATLAARCRPARRGDAAPVVRAMRRFGDFVAIQTAGCTFISRLSSDGEESANGLAELGCLDLVFETLEAHPEDADIAWWAFLALQNLTCGTSEIARARRERALSLGWLPQMMRHIEAEPFDPPPSPKSQGSGQQSPKSVLSRMSSTRSLLSSASGAKKPKSHSRLEMIFVASVHCICSSMAEAELESLLADEILNLLFVALDATAFPLEARERACLLLCYLANFSEKVATAISRAGSPLWQSMLATLKDHLAVAEAEEKEFGDMEKTVDEILLDLPVPGEDVESCWLRAQNVSRPGLLLEAMRALPYETRIQVTGCTAWRKMALMAAVDRGRDREAVVAGLPIAVQLAVAALRGHERSAEAQQRATMALQALLRLSTASGGEGEDAANARLVSLGAVPLLARALENYPDDPELQERGLDVLRVIATGGRLPDVEDSLSYLGAVPMLVKVMNLNIARPKIQEYGLTLLSEIGWQGGDRQLEILLEDGVEVTVRALRAFPAERDVQLHGLAAVQALTTGNEECRVRFFTLADILEIVMEAMANFPLVEGIQAFGCAALVSLVHSKSERVGALADLNGQSLAESALVSHPQSARVVELAEQLLQVLKKG